MRYGIAHPDRQVREAIKRTVAMRASTFIQFSAGHWEDVQANLNRDKVDLLLLDVSLAGKQAGHVQSIRQQHDCAVMLLANDPDAAMATVYEALSFGALAVVYPPNLTASGELVSSSQLLSKLDRFGSLLQAPPGKEVIAEHRSGHLIAIGASTGGPSAILSILQSLSVPFPLPILLVQHIEHEFLAGLASWLSMQSKHEVVLAKRGEVPQAGKVYLADGAGHLVLLANGQLTYLSAHVSDVHVPSVDMLFKSLAENASGTAVLLTGMGEDGAAGMLKMRQRGWTTLAQDQSSCAVFGMPRAAIQLSAVTRIVELNAMGQVIHRSVSRTPVREN